MSAITLCAPRRLASMAERMLASSELVSAANTSALSMFSSISSSSSAASPCSTMALSRSSAIRRARRASRSMSFTWLCDSSERARRKPMLPPPAITMRRAGSSPWRSSSMTRRMSLRAARKKISSPSATTVSPSGAMARPSRYIATTRTATFGRCPASSPRPCPTRSPPRRARRLEHGGVGGVAGDGAHVEPVLELAQHVLVHVHHGDFVGLLAREVVSRGATHLTGAQDEDLHGLRALGLTLQRLEIRVLHHQPLGALALEAHLHARLQAGALDVEDH